MRHTQVHSYIRPTALIRLAALLALAAGVSFRAMAPSNPWHPTFDKAKEQAKVSEKDILVYLYAPRSERCLKMRREVLIDVYVAHLYQAFELVQVDIAQDEKLARELAPEAFVAPIVAVLYPSGETKEVLDNLKSSDEWKARLDALVAQAGGAFDSVEQMYDKALECAKKGQFDLAEKLYKRSLSLASDKSPAYNGLGFIAAQKKDYKRAIECFKQALAIDPNYRKAKDNLEQAEKMLQSQPARPDLALTPAPEPTPDLKLPKGKQDIRALLAKAQAALKENKLEDAKDLFLRILNKDKSSVLALNYLGQIALKQKNYDAAIDYYNRLLQFDPKNQAAQTGLDEAKKKSK